MEIDKNAFENGQRKKLCVGEKVERKTSNKSLRDPIKIQKGPLSNVCIKKRATNSCLRLSIGSLIVSHEKKKESLCDFLDSPTRKIFKIKRQ
jgi:hypothetical protein